MKVLDNTEDSELEICVKKDNEKTGKGNIVGRKKCRNML